MGKSCQIVQFGNAAADWISSREWDGKSRVLDICNAIKYDAEFADKFDIKFVDKLVTNFLRDAVTAAFNEDGKQEHRQNNLLVFKGPQGIGKTTFLRRLVGKNLYWFGDGISLYKAASAYCPLLEQYWITELDGLAGLTKRKLLAAQGFISAIEYWYKAPYQPRTERIRRKTVFVGTTNEQGNLPKFKPGQFICCLPVASFDDISHIDLQQVYAEIKYEQAQIF